MREVEETTAASWDEWRSLHQGPPRSRPDVPLLLKAPPLGCDEHPNGTQEPCGPCGTARKWHEKWLARQRFGEQLTLWETEQGEEVIGDDDEPF